MEAGNVVTVLGGTEFEILAGMVDAALEAR